MSLSTTLSDGRTAAEARMSDTCTITAGGTKTWNPTTEEYELVGGTTIYADKCRVKKADTQATEPDAGGTTGVVVRTEVDIPVDGYSGLVSGARILIDSSQFNALLAGVDLRITNVVFESQGTALRLICTQEQ